MKFLRINMLKLEQRKRRKPLAALGAFDSLLAKTGRKMNSTPMSQNAALFCLAFAVSLSVACTRSHSSSSQAEQPDLKETIEWINQTYNPDPDKISYKNHGVFDSQTVEKGIYVTLDRKRTTLRLDGCAATIEEKQDPNLRMSTDVHLVSETETFNLGDIDPTRIKIEKVASTADAMLCDDAPTSTCDEADIGLHTRNQKEAIKSHRVMEYPKLTGADHMSVTDSMGDSAFLFVNNLEYLPRLVTALKHGIELCGGKPSSF
jgi:hypothetical protein